MAGSLRGNARLFRAKLVLSPGCPLCGAPKEDQEHMFQGCPNTNEVRKPYCHAIAKIVDDLWINESSEFYDTHEQARIRKQLKDVIQNDVTFS